MIEIEKFVKKELGIDVSGFVEKPKIESQGDFAIPMFMFAKEMKKAPNVIAIEFSEKLNKKLPSFLSKVVAVGPYLNFYLNNSKVLYEIFDGISSGKSLKVKVLKPQKILIEYPSPNTNKSLHIGHVRNILLGNSLSHIFKKVGHKIIRTNLNNDRGIAICKAMLGYELYYKNETPKSLGLKSDEFVGQCYVKFESEAQKDESLNNDAQQMLVKWENKDKTTIDLWKKLLTWVYEGYEDTYNRLKLGGFDKQYFESEIYNKGKEIVEKALKDKVNGFKEEDGAILVDFENETYGKKYLLRSDGTTLYMTQDIYLASLKEKEFKADKYIFIVGKEQEYHFQVLFDILGRLGFGGVDKNYHYAYGYVYNKDGKKFSSRKGNALRADGLLDLVEERAKENLLSKELTKDLSEKELNKRSKIIGHAALAFTMLNTNPTNDMKFDVEKALAFEGETGPYIQYTYARIQSVLKKANYKKNKIDLNLFDESEISLIKLLGEYSNVLLESAEKYKPSTIGNYLIKISQKFNEFYQNKNILKEKVEIRDCRLVLCEMVSIILKDGLELLDIDVLDEM